MSRRKETRGGWNRKYTTDKQRQAAAAKQRQESLNRTMKAISIRFHKVNDADVIAMLDQQENKADYIRQLIRADIESKK